VVVMNYPTTRKWCSFVPLHNDHDVRASMKVVTAVNGLCLIVLSCTAAMSSAETPRTSLGLSRAAREIDENTRFLVIISRNMSVLLRAIQSIVFSTNAIEICNIFITCNTNRSFYVRRCGRQLEFQRCVW